ncbi:MAG TPA: cytochrome c oxidase subunit II [Thermoanaerobaculia bacterium]|nr:cytochrome c oxidase subunit II [Thermoanaerobaculia bacterium]
MWPDFPLFPDAASSLARDIDLLFFAWLAVSLFFTVLIAVVIVVFFIHFRRRYQGQIGDTREPRTLPLEVTWSVIPLIIALTLFTWGAIVFFDIRTPPADAVEYWVTGKQWMWKVQHPSGVREINTLHVPVGQTVKLTMTSEDVIHDFYIPAFRVKQDVLPGRYTSLWFQPTRVGTYHLFCAEYCGAEHSLMGGSIVVLTPEDYERWLATGTAGPSMQASGAELFGQLACDTCHRVEGAWAPDAGMPARAPALEGLFGQQVALASGRTVVADENYIRESILNPQAKIVAGWQPIMPTFKGQITEEQLNALVAYVREMGGSGAAAAGPEVGEPPRAEQSRRGESGVAVDGEAAAPEATEPEVTNR